MQPFASLLPLQGVLICIKKGGEGVFEKGRGAGESGGGRWPTVGGRSQAANWQRARGGGREVLIGLDGGGGSRTYLRQDLHPHAFSPPTF